MGWQVKKSECKKLPNIILKKEPISDMLDDWQFEVFLNKNPRQ
jgi:hypothetical protein